MIEVPALFDDGHQHVDPDGDPYLCFHGIVGGAIKNHDAKVLLNPLEEQLHLTVAEAVLELVSHSAVTVRVTSVRSPSKSSSSFSGNFHWVELFRQPRRTRAGWVGTGIELN